MLKSISAALISVAVLAAPALAATPAKDANAPAIKTEQVVKPTARTQAVKTSAGKNEASKASESRRRPIRLRA